MRPIASWPEPVILDSARVAQALRRRAAREAAPVAEDGCVVRGLAWAVVPALAAWWAILRGLGVLP